MEGLWKNKESFSDISVFSEISEKNQDVRLLISSFCMRE